MKRWVEPLANPAPGSVVKVLPLIPSLTRRPRKAAKGSMFCSTLAWCCHINLSNQADVNLLNRDVSILLNPVVVNILNIVVVFLLNRVVVDLLDRDKHK